MTITTHRDQIHEQSDRYRAVSGSVCSAAVLIFVVGSIILPGCGYMVGSVYQADVRSVHVPVFKSDAFRRGLEFQLTDAVQKEIQNQTHFRLARDGNADSRLTGRIVRINKQVLGESGFDDPRELELAVAVEITWEDLRTGQIIAQQRVPLENEQIQLLSTGSFAPEVGQSLATAEQQVVSRLARQIVEMMEMPW